MTTTTRVLLDTSAYLALINDEPGADIVTQHINDAYMSTVNIAEVVTFLVRNGYSDQEKINRIINLIHPLVYDKNVAIASGELVKHTKTLGLSLGDRACLAQAKVLGIPAYTADKKWSKVADTLNIKVVQIR